MHILIIGPIPPKFGGASFGGIATHIEGLSNALVNKNYSVSLWYHKLQKADTFGRLKIIKNNILDYLFAIPLTISFIVKKELHYLTISQRILFGFQVFRLKKILKQNTFNCIHIHSLHNTSAIAFQYINTRTCPRIIISDHGFWQDSKASVLNSKSYKKIEAVVKQCEKVIYISNYAKQKHLSIDFGQQNKLVKIKNPIVVGEKIKNKVRTREGKTIFFNGLNESLKIKQLDILLKAIQQDDYLREHIKVIAIANNDAHKFVAKNNFDFEIELHASIIWDNVKDLYARSDLFVLPSKSESFGLVYLEALSFGIPIIAFEDIFNEFQSNISEYIGEPFNSKHETITQLGDKIRKALNYPFKYKNVYKALEANYNWESNIVYYENIYNN